MSNAEALFEAAKLIGEKEHELAEALQALQEIAEFKLELDIEGPRFIAEFTDVPGALAYGTTILEAVVNARKIRDESIRDKGKFK